MGTNPNPKPETTDFFGYHTQTQTRKTHFFGFRTQNQTQKPDFFGYEHELKRTEAQKTPFFQVNNLFLSSECNFMLLLYSFDI